MTHDPSSLDEPERPGRLSQNGQMAAIGVYGFLVLVGFFFGIVTGYDSPKPVAKAPKEKDPAPPRPDPRPAPKVTPPKPEPKVGPKEEPQPEPKKEEPKPEPKVVEPPKAEPKKVEPPPEPTVPVVSFQKDVLPIFRSYCFDCHGPTKRDEGVDLRTLAAVMKGGDGGRVILVPGQPDKSTVFTSVEDNSMPKNRKDKVPPGQLLVIKNWILGGAKPRRRRRVS
ncbi:MAG: hypothetical protein C0501_30110 [Isosphaera sp.]|nr:hypothetical protein [Isosphaera sp.]